MPVAKLFDLALSDFPIIAILRGVEPSDVLEIGEVLYEAGFKIIEVPLNSPQPLKSIEILSKNFEDRAIIGAGTVLNTNDVSAVHQAGGQIIISPNTNANVIKRTKELGMLSAPGVQTPTEVFNAIEAGADCLKFFPGETITPVIFKAIKAVMPPTMPCFIVGGVKPNMMAEYQKLGAAGFGAGSAIFKTGDKATDVKIKANAFKDALEK